MAATTQAETPVRRRRGGPAALTGLRVIATAHLVAIFAQPVFAGMYLSGNYNMLAVHNLGADIVFGLGLVQLVTALVLWWRGRLRWPSLAGLLLALGEIGQVFTGLGGALDLHVPLGVALVTGAAVMVVALWRPQTLRGDAVPR